MSEATVRKLHEHVEPAPAVGCSFTTVLGGDRQIVLQTHFAQDQDDESINTLLDRLLSIGDRQKAKYDLEKTEDEFRTVGVALTNLIDGFPIAERNFAKEQVQRSEKLEALRQEQSEVRDAAYDEFTKAGKRGSFVLKGHAQGNFNRIGAAIAQLEEREKSAESDRAQHRETLLSSVKHYQQDLAKKRLKLNAIRAMAGMEANTEFLDEEKRQVEGL